MGKMNLNKLRQELEEVYFEGMVNNYWQVDLDKFTGMLNDANVNIPKSYVVKMETIEEILYNGVLNYQDVKTMVPFKNAIKRYEVIQQSPLYKALEEDK
jgi:hypothetical protein